MKYEARSIYKFDEPKDNYGNLKIQQYGSGYDFKLEDQLKPYNIKEPENPKRFSEVINSLKDGERQSVTAISNKGAAQNLLIEAVLCYGTIIFFTPEGKPQIRESFLKEGIQMENVFSWKLELKAVAQETRNEVTALNNK